MRSAKIICTLGPASETVERIEALARAGMSVGRLNASHGTSDHRREMIERIRTVDSRLDRPVAAMLDMPGPEIRTADVENPVVLEAGSTVTFQEGDDATSESIGLSRSIAAVQPGNRVMIDDGRIETVVERVEEDVVYATVETGGELDSRKGVIVPGVDLGLPAITESDRRELDVAAEMEPDFVAASFVRSGEDVYNINTALNDRGVDIPVIAKIERGDAVDNIDSIVTAADGVMVGRGDLGVELPFEDVPIIQKRIIRRCLEEGVPVITATEMLDSMVHERRPTRAEASDVANAVLDGTDAVMLSEETAVGDHPVTVVETMDSIVRKVESSDEYAESREQRIPEAGESRTDALASAARDLARNIGAAAVVVASESGYTARKAAKYRPSIPIVAATPDDRVRRELSVSWGTLPVSATYSDDGTDAIIRNAVQSALETDVANGGDTVVVLSGMMADLEGLDTANMLKVHVASEIVASGKTVGSGVISGPVHRTRDGDVSEIPEGAVLIVPSDFEGEFEGDVSSVGAIVTGHHGITSYAAIVARELDIPLIADATIPDDITDGTEVTLDAERGVVYEGAVDDRTTEGGDPDRDA